MPISIQEAMKSTPQPSAAPPTPGAQQDGGVSQQPPPAEDGAGPTSGPISIKALYAQMEKNKPPTTGQKVGAAVKSGAKQAGQVFSDVSVAATRPYLDDAVQWSKDYAQALREDVRAYPQGLGAQVMQSLKTANDAIGYATGPLMSPVYTGVINPVKKAIAELGNLVQKHAADDAYDAQARREGARGQQYPKGIDWEVHKADVQRTVNDLQTATEAMINAGVGMVGGEHIGFKKAAERPVAAARAAVQDIKGATAPPPPPKAPTPPPVASYALDKTFGFQGVAEKAGLDKIPAGSTRNARVVLDDMTPHATGYAEKFLNVLTENLHPDTTVKFKQVAGQNVNHLGVYMPGLKQIEIKAGGPDIVHTVVHEMTHAATLHIMDELIHVELKGKALELGRDLTPTEKLKVVNAPSHPLLKQLDSVITEAKLRAQKAGVQFYGLQGMEKSFRGNLRELAFDAMSPRYEFVAEAFSNPKFQEFLASSEKYASTGYKVKNLLNQFAHAIGKHLGFSKPHELKLLNQAMDVGSRLIRTQKETGIKDGRNIQNVVAHLPDGGTITRGEMKYATVARVGDGAALRRAKTALQISVEGILRAVSPESLGRQAKLAASVVASRLTEQMQKTSAWRHGAETRQKFWKSRTDLAREFVNKFEKGHSFSDPVLQDLAERYKKWGQEVFEQDQKITGLNYEPRDNYLYHVFDDQEGVSNYFNQKYGSKWGDPKFVKDRAFELYKEAVAAGFRPKYDNPEDIMLARQHASDVAEMHTKILADLEKYGLAVKKVKGGTKLVKTLDAEGKMKLDLQETKGNTQPEGTVRWRAPNGEIYWVDPKADVVLSNAFKSKSLWADKSAVGMGFRGMMAVKNAIVPIRLAVSLFHPLHVVGIDIAAGWTRASAELLSGTRTPVRALGEFLRSGFGPVFENPKAGWRVMQVWKGKVAKEALSAADAEALHYIIEGGMIPEMSSEYRVNARQNFGNALRGAMGEFRGKRVGGVAGQVTKAVWHLPWATISAMSAPIFEHWIPSLKTASYLKDVKSILERNPHLLEDDAARQLALRKIAKSVDNRYGEMAYNTLFWKRWIKDLAVVDTLSLGWQLGFLREYGGGAMDLGQFAAGSGKISRIKAGQLDRPLFVGAYTALGAGTAGLMTYGMTGEYPKDLMDWISPRTGEKNADGSDQRVSTMFYSREFAALYKHMENEGAVKGVSQLVMNKGSGLFGLMHEWVTGMNDFNQEIRDPESDAFTQLEQTLAYTLTDLEPISMKGLQDNLGTETAAKSTTLSVLGFTPAPKYLTESKATASIKQAYDKYVAPKQTPYEKAEYSKEYTELRKAYQSGADSFGDRLDSMTEKYNLTAKDQRRMMKSLNSDLTPEVRMFMRLPWQEQKRQLDGMTEEERDLFLPHSNREHVRNVYEAPEK